MTKSGPCAVGPVPARTGIADAIVDFPAGCALGILRGITTYTWTDDDQLAAVTLPNGGGTITNTYNGGGMRFSRTDANGTSSFAWNGKVLDAQLGAGNSVTIHKNLSRCAGAQLLLK